MRRTPNRRLVRVLLIAAAVVCAAGVYWYWFHSITNPDRLLRYLPPSDAPLLYCNVAALRRSGVLGALAGPKTSSESEYVNFVAGTKFDYRTDLDAVLVSFQGPATYYIVSGRFRGPALASYARANGGGCVNDLCRMPASDPQKQISFYLLAPRLLALAVAPDGYAASLVARRQKAIPREFPPEPVWLTLSGRDIRKESLPAGTRAFASALEGAEELSLALGSEAAAFQAVLRVTCRTTADAAQLNAQLTSATETLRTLIAREKGQPNPADLSGVLTSGRFQQDDRRVLGRWPMPDALLKTLTEGTF